MARVKNTQQPVFRGGGRSEQEVRHSGHGTEVADNKKNWVSFAPRIATPPSECRCASRPPFSEPIFCVSQDAEPDHAVLEAVNSNAELAEVQRLVGALHSRLRRLSGPAAMTAAPTVQWHSLFGRRRAPVG